MAVPKGGRITRVEDVGAARVLEVALEEPLGFAGGQYVIVDSGLRSAEGKAVKRAYSILSSDREQSAFQLAVKRIEGGAGTNYMHGLEAGATLTFSGPWGKLRPPRIVAGPAFLLATDTGISAALGFVNGLGAAPLLPSTTLYWLRESGEYFLPDAWVQARVPDAVAELRIGVIPPVGHPERIPYARQLLRQHVERSGLGHGYATGDGLVNYALLDDFVAAGLPATRDDVESFFNMPRKSA